MNFTYGMGAAVVIIGALFKIQHYPGASILLIIGLCTEAAIFALSAFEPVDHELDWSLVYPELAGGEKAAVKDVVSDDADGMLSSNLCAHHYLIHSINKVNGKILWANLHLLFWLSLIPVATGWMGEHNFAKASMALYGFVLLLCSIAYFILQRIIILNEGKNSIIAKAIGKDVKGNMSSVLYIVGIVFSFYNEWISGVAYFTVAMLWLIPDKRIERFFPSKE